MNRYLLIGLACVATGLLTGAEPAYEWKLVTMKAAFAPRDGAGIVSYRGKMWLLGGWNPNNALKAFFPLTCNNEVWSSADGLDWKLERANTFRGITIENMKKFDAKADWEGRHTAGYIVYQDAMWIVGGDCNQGHYQPDVWKSSDGKAWTNVNAGKPTPWGQRALHHTLVHDDKIWVIGGQTVPQFAAAEEAFYRDIWISSDGIDWKQVTPKEPFWPQRGMIGGSAVMNGRIWILGGGTYDTAKLPQRKYFNDVWSSANGIDWKQHTANAPWHPRQYHDVAVWDNCLWVMEGFHEKGGNRNDVWYSSDGENWTELPKTPWKPRHAASLVVHDGHLWMIAGNNMEPDVWKLVKK